MSTEVCSPGAWGYRYVATFCYGAILVLAGSSVNILGPAGPTIARNMNVGIASIGAIFTAEGIGNMLGSSMVGSVLERHKAHSVICVLCFLVFVAVALVPTCSSLSQVMLLYLVVGSCIGLLNGTANTLVTWVQRGHNVGVWVNLVNSCAGVGASGAPLLFVLVERYIGNGLAAFSAIGLFAGLPACVAWFVQSPNQPPPTTPPAPSPTKGVGYSRRRPTIAGVDLGSREAYVRCTVLAPLLTVVVLVIGAEVSYSAWIYSYAIERVGTSSKDAAWLNSLFWSSFTVGRMLISPLAACLSPGALLIPGLTINFCSNLVVLSKPDSPLFLWWGTGGAGIGVCVFYSNTISLLAHYDLLSTRTTGAIGVAAAVGHMSLPNIIGHTIQHSALEYDALILFVASANLVGLLLTACVVLHLGRNFTPLSELRGFTICRRPSGTEVRVPYRPVQDVEVATLSPQTL